MRRRAMAFWILGLAVAALAMAGKIQRLYTIRVFSGRGYSSGVPILLDFLRPEFFLGLALALGAIDLLRRRGRRWGAGAAFAAGGGLAAAVGLTEIAGNHYYKLSGGEVISFDLLVFVAERADALLPMVGTEVGGVAGVTGLFAGAGLLAAALYASARGPVPPGPVPAGGTWAWLACLAISCAPSPYLGFHPSNRTMTLNLMTSLVDSRFDPEVNQLEGFSRAFPVETKLVPTRPGARPRDVVVIFLESTRASATGLYEPRYATTPFLDSLAPAARVFERAYTVMPHTSKAITGALCGVEPWLGLGVPESEPGKGIPARCLGALFGEAGYETGFFMSAPDSFENHALLTENFGFDTLISQEDLDHAGYALTPYLGLEEDAVLPASRAWLDGVPPEKPVFMAFLSVISHHPYRAPPDFPPRPYPPHPAVTAPEDFEKHLNCVRYSDRWVRQIFEQLEAAGRFEDTIFLVLGDHGEGFGEHGRRFHDVVIYNEGIQIPALLYDPRNPVGVRQADPVSTLDFLPTLVEEAGFKIEGAGYAGTHAARRPPGRPVFSHCFRKAACMAVIEGPWKLIHHFGVEPDELFQVVEDRDETRDVIADHPARAAELRSKLRRWRLENLVSYRAYYRGRAAGAPPPAGAPGP